MKTVTVRVALIVDETGSWYATGWGPGTSDNTIMGTAQDVFEGGGGQEKYVWLTAEVELPQTAEVVATVRTDNALQQRPEKLG